MNEELSKALAELLNKANNGIDAAGNFLEAELPEVISQLLMWHGVYNFVIMFWTPIYITLMYQTVKPFLNSPITEEETKTNRFFDWYDYGKEPRLSDSPVVMIRLVFLFFFGIGGAAMSIKSLNLEWLQIWIAPKVWLLEYAARLAS